MTRRPLVILLGTRRLLALATIALILAACDVATRSPSPSLIPSPAAPSQVAIATQIPTVPPTPGPSPNRDCPTIESLFAEHPFYADAQIDPGIARVDLQVTSIAPVWDPSARVIPQPREVDSGYPDPGVILGGREFTTHPSYFGYLAGGASKLQSATVTFTPDNQSAIGLASRFVPGNENFDQVAATVPDIEGDGLLALNLEWTDDCFRFTAMGSTSVRIVPKVATEGCSLNQDHWADDVGGLFDKGITVGSTKQDLFPTSFSARYVNEGTGGDPPNWAYEWKQHPGGITASSGGWLEVSDSVKSRHLSVIDAELIRRTDAISLANDWTAAVSALWNHRPTPRADGSFRIPVAAEPGRYVLVVRFAFTSTCLMGTATSAFSLEVK